MILGRNRVPYAGPPQANPNFRPGMPHTRFLTNIDPFSNVHRRMAAFSPFHPQTCSTHQPVFPTMTSSASIFSRHIELRKRPEPADGPCAFRRFQPSGKTVAAWHGADRRSMAGLFRENRRPNAKSRSSSAAESEYPAIWNGIHPPPPVKYKRKPWSMSGRVQTTLPTDQVECPDCTSSSKRRGYPLIHMRMPALSIPSDNEKHRRVQDRVCTRFVAFPER